ncbi:hypothetical protein C8R48DRAFT_671722 [Suillus tomentosus]|nr:hypothetical protein C8R48DRAFT_671722 [Suillus tomentosus]
MRIWMCRGAGIRMGTRDMDRTSEGPDEAWEYYRMLACIPPYTTLHLILAVSANCLSWSIAVYLAGSHASVLLPPALLHTACRRRRFYSSAAITQATTTLYNICPIFLTQNLSTSVVCAPPACSILQAASHLILQCLRPAPSGLCVPRTLPAPTCFPPHYPCPPLPSTTPAQVLIAYAYRFTTCGSHHSDPPMPGVVYLPTPTESSLGDRTIQLFVHLVRAPTITRSQLIAYAYRILTWGSHYSTVCPPESSHRLLMPLAGGHSKLKGLSKSIISHNFRGRHRQTHILKASHQLQCKEAADAGHQAQVQDVERGPPVGTYYSDLSLYNTRERTCIISRMIRASGPWAHDKNILDYDGWAGGQIISDGGGWAHAGNI